MVANSAPRIKTWLVPLNTGPFIKAMAVLVFVAANPIFLSVTERTTIPPTICTQTRQHFNRRADSAAKSQVGSRSTDYTSPLCSWNRGMNRPSNYSSRRGGTGLPQPWNTTRGVR